MKLNAEQKKAVETLEGSLLVVAGPGTGKTQLLSARAANILNTKDVTAENILILSYTNAAAKSVRERLAKLVGMEGYRITSETFHGFANSIILDSEEASNILRERIQITEIEKVGCLEYILNNFTSNVKNLRPFGYPTLYVREIAQRISELKNEGITPQEFESSLKDVGPDGIHIEKKHIPRLKELAFIYRKYEELKTGKEASVFDERGRYDYDDMILFAIKVLEKEKELRLSYHKRYKYIMIDEFQDTNGAQLKLLLMLCGEKKPNLCCVGDDDQSIYRFQGANIANFRILKERFPSTKVIGLRDNYRSSKDIINLSSSIISHVPGENRWHQDKALIPKKIFKNLKTKIEVLKFSTEDEEIVYLTTKIKKIVETLKKVASSSEERKTPYNQIAILVRKRSLIPKIIDSLLRAGIPYATDGKEDITREKRVRQLIDALFLARPKTESIEEKDLALYRILSCDFMGITQRDILRFIGFINKKKDRYLTGFLWEFLEAFPAEDKDQKSPSLNDTKKLDILKKLKLENPHNMHRASWAIKRLLTDTDARPVHDVIMGFIEDTALYKYIITAYEKDKILITRDLRSLTSFVNMIKNMSMARPDLRLTDFLEELETMKLHRIPLEGNLVTQTQDGVRLITAHASKGLEFYACFIPFCVQDKNWPLKPPPERIPLPREILKAKENIKTKRELLNLAFYDETRLFYVAATRAKANLIFTASPSENAVASSFFDSLAVEVKEMDEREEPILKEFLSRTKEEERDRFKDTESVLRDLVKNLVLTPTKVNNYLKCKRRFLYDNLLLLPGKKRSSLVFGTCAHKALEDTYRKFKEEKNFPDFTSFSESFKRELKFQGAGKKMEKECLAKLEDLKGWFLSVEKNPVMPIDLEKKKIVTLKGDIALSGKYDKVEFEDERNKLIRIIDYKTGKPDDHVRNIEITKDLMSEDADDYLRQLVAYKLLYEKDTYEPARYKVSHGVLVFLEPVRSTSRKYSLTKGQYIDKKVSITDEMVGSLEEVVRKIWLDISSLKFEKLPERSYKKCDNCSYDSICWG